MTDNTFHPPMAAPPTNGLGSNNNLGRLNPPAGGGGNTPGNNSANDLDHVHAPSAVAYEAPTGAQKYGDDRGDHIHSGADYAMAWGTQLYAICKSKVVYAGDWGDNQGMLVKIQALEDRGPADKVSSVKKGDVYGYGHMSTIDPKVYADLTANSGYATLNPGDPVGKSGHGKNGQDHLHFFLQRPAGGTDGNTDPDPLVKWVSTGQSSTQDSSGNVLDPTGAGGAGYSAEQITKAGAFSSIMSFPGAINSVESIALKGHRSMLNDEPLLPFIDQICKASLRTYMSMPNGKFYAFYPDYFGGFGRQPYWNIEDIEIISGKIDLSDDNLATHVFIVGDTQPGSNSSFSSYGQIDWVDKINTTGVIDIFNAWSTGFLNGKVHDPKKGVTGTPAPDELNKEGAIKFLQKYGARRYYDPVPAVRSPIYETFLAFQTFCLLWAKQFITTFEFTFMPELFPGGIVAFPDHGLQCYVEEVVHTGSYTEGFSTVAQLSAPAALKNANMDPDKEWIHTGMVRAFVNSEIGNPGGDFKGTEDMSGGNSNQ